jgi:hypothetical protein
MQLMNLLVKAGLKPKREYCHEKHDLALKAAVAKATYDKVYACS